ncbi:unnamed protein product, partial [Mesorhabditis belari]|uniref:Uncharacterized protein n=1 Tax=Mesorhabditis belari TaxID=2138241 RepID=A0AAF3EE64_9BILA
MNHTDEHSMETTLEPNESDKKEELYLNFPSEQEKNEQTSEVTNKNHIIRKRRLGEASEMVNAGEDLDVLNKRQAIQKEEQSISSSAGQRFLAGGVNKEELKKAIVSVLKYGVNVQELENEIDRAINDPLKSKALTNKMLPSLEKGNVEFSAENATFDVNKLLDSICDFINNQQPFKIRDEEFEVTKCMQDSLVYVPVQWEAKVMIDVNNTMIQFIAEINLDNPTSRNLYPCLPSDAHFGFEFKYKSDEDWTEEKNSALKGIPKIKGHVIMEDIERRDSLPKRTREKAIFWKDIPTGALIYNDDWIVTGNRNPHEKSDKNANRIENPEQREISPSV